MSRNVMDKLAKGESLDDEDVAWARARGIELPEEYGEGPVPTVHAIGDLAGLPPDVLVQTGAMPPGGAGPGVFLSQEDLEKFTVDQLHEIADVLDVDTAGVKKKADLVSVLSGTESVSVGDEEADEED